jgi:hypothetical protein
VHLRLGQFVDYQQRRKTVRIFVRVSKWIGLLSLKPAGVQLREHKTSDDALIKTEVEPKGGDNLAAETFEF